MRTVLLASALLAVACSKSSPPPTPQVAADQNPARGTKPADPKATGEKKQFEILAGTLVEQAQSGPYTLFKIKTAAGEVWAAVPHTDRKVGDEVKVSDPLPVKNFESKPLKRTFAVVYFGNLG